MRTIGKALAVSFRTKSRFSLMITLLGFPAALLSVGIAKVLGRFTDSVQQLYYGQESVGRAAECLIVMILLYAVQAIYHAAERYCVEIDKISVNHFIEKTVMDCSASVEYKYIENENNYRERLTFMEQYGAERVAVSMNQTVKMLHHFIAFLTVTIALADVDWRLPVILLVTCIPAVWIARAQNDETYLNNTKSMKEAAMSVHLFYIAAGAEDHCRAMNTVRFTGSYPWLKKKWREVSDDFVEKKKRIAKKYLGWNMVADCLRNGVYLVVLLIAAGRLYRDPSLGLGVFTSVYLLARQLQTAAGNMLISGSTLVGDIPYIKDFFELQEIPKEPQGKTVSPMQNADIVCEHMSFSYPNADKEALHDINVTIRQGEKIAIVGHNGSGKSTFVNLLCGMYEPTNGSITVGGQKVYDILQTVRDMISVVFQNFGRYEASLRTNITIGDTEKIPSDEGIMRLAKRTGADMIIDEQPGRLDEEVGSFSARGNNLSGGQWQKIALTRALYRDKSRIIILDEPTAALDPVAEADLYRNFAKLTGDKTTLLISHRLGIATVVDRILVFDGGRIVEDGTHEELLALGGVYAKLYEAQAAWY